MQNLLHVPVIIILYQGNSGLILVCAMRTEFGQMYQYCVLIHGKVILWTLNASCLVCVWENIWNLSQIKHQLDAKLCRFYFCRVTLHVSGASAHHQEYLKLVQRPLVHVLSL